MASIFEEIANLDRPFFPVTLEFGGKQIDFQARRPNALEADAIEAYYSEHYAKLILAKTEPGAELDQMLRIAATRTREQIVENLLGTRKKEIDRRAYEIADFDISAEFMKIVDMPEAEREEYQKEQKAKLSAAAETARQEFREEYREQTDEKLQETLAQINVNIASLIEAQNSRNAMFIHVTLYDASSERVCPSAESVRETFQVSTIDTMVRAIEEALTRPVRADLPFESSDEGEHNGQPTSANTSEPETTPLNPGGTPTDSQAPS